MAKSFKLQVNPTFKAPVEIPRIGADPMRVSFVFKAMNRLELARMFDKWKEEGQEMVDEMRRDAANENQWTLEKLAAREIELQVSQLKDIVVGWGFEDEFNDENIEALVTTAVSVSEAIVDQYHDAYQRARKGN